jgi:hypothetical protein
LGDSAEDQIYYGKKIRWIHRQEQNWQTGECIAELSKELIREDDLVKKNRRPQQDQKERMAAKKDA